MGNGKTTASARVFDEDFDWVKDALNENEAVDNGITQLIRTTFSLYRSDQSYRDFMNRKMAGDEIKLKEYTSLVSEEYDLIDSDDFQEAEEGIQDLISGVQNNIYSQAIRGGRKLETVDEKLGKDAAQYLASMPESYWNDI